jgi:lipopolysaccharide export system protein LptA
VGQFLFFVLGLAIAALPAFAEKADRNKQIDIKAQDGTHDQINRTYELRGNATLTQGTMRLVAERMIVKVDEDGNRTAKLYGSPGNPVSFRQKREGFDDYMEGTADRAEFDDATDVLQLYFNASLKNGGDELRGEYIYYNSATEVLRASAAAPDRKDAPAEGKREVHITLMPRDQGKSAGKPPSRVEKP